MRITEHILAFTLLGSEWVLWLLVLLSILSVAVMVERGIAMSGRLADFETLSEKLHKALTAGDGKAAREVLGAPNCPEVRVALVGLDELPRGSTAAVEAMAGARSRERLALEKHLGILGTLGNNAPFIGLFGTVIGIIKAFADLAKNQGGGAAVVMSGIAEAVVATAVGLMVALPAVVAFNIFQGRIRRTMGRVDALAHMILTGARDETAKGADICSRLPRCAAITFKVTSAGRDMSAGIETCKRPCWSVDSLRPIRIFPSRDKRSISSGTETAVPVTSVVRMSNWAAAPDCKVEGPVTISRRCSAAIAAIWNRW